MQNVASAALFLAAKVEEQPQKLEYVARVYYACINRDNPNIDSSSEVRGMTLFLTCWGCYSYNALFNLLADVIAAMRMLIAVVTVVNMVIVQCFVLTGVYQAD